MMRKIINSILVVLITASMVWAVAPKYKIGQESDMTSPPNIGVTTPGTGRFDTLKVTGASLSTSAGTGFYSLGTSSFIGDITISSNATTRATGPFIISGAFNFTGQVQGTADNINIGQVAPGKGKFTTLEATGGITGALTGNAATATALAANGANCSAGQYPKGVDASGAVESCTAVTLTTDVTGVLPVANGGVPTTTKGDLAGYSTANARVPVGTDGQVLTADSTQALGLKWAAAGGGGKLGQVVFYSQTPASGAYFSTNSTIFADVTVGGVLFEKSITTTNNSSKVLVSVVMNLGSGNTGNVCGLRLRNTTNAATLITNAQANGITASENLPTSLQYLDTPGVSGTYNYRLQINKLAGSGDYCYALWDYSSLGAPTGTITLMEVLP